MSEIYSDVDEAESILDEDEDEEYGDQEFEELEDDINTSPPQHMNEDAFSPIQVSTKSMASSNHDYDDDYEEDVDEDNDYADEYDDDDDDKNGELKECSVIVAGETDVGEISVAKPPHPTQKIQSKKGTEDTGADETHEASNQLEKSRVVKQKKSKKNKRLKVKPTNLQSTLPEKDETIDPIAVEATEKPKPKSILKKTKSLSESPKHSTLLGKEENILKRAVDVALDILNGGKTSKENEPINFGKSGNSYKGRRKIPFKGATPITSRRPMESSPLESSTQQPLSQYQALLSEITTRSSRSRVIHSPSGFDHRGLSESNAEANVAAAWRPDEAWATDTMKHASNQSNREKKLKKKGKKSRTHGKRPTMMERDAASRAKLMEEYLNSTKHETKEHAPVGVPGVRELKKSYVYDIHGRKTTAEEFEASKTRVEEEKKKDEERKKLADQAAQEARKLLPPKPTVRQLGELHGNIKQAYEQYVKHRKEQVAQMSDIVSQFRSARLHWLDMRVEDIFPSPGDSQAQKEALLASSTNNYGQPVMWGMYSAIEEGDVMISIETKTRPGTSPYSRHNPSTYKDAVSTLWRSIVEVFRGRAGFRIAVEVCGGFGESKRSKPMEGRPEARLGSFEVQVAYRKDDRLFVEVLFSKLQSHHWPHTGRLVDKISSLLTKKGFNIAPSTSEDETAVTEPVADWRMAVQSGASAKFVVWLVDGRDKSAVKTVGNSAPLMIPAPLSNTALSLTSELNITAAARTMESPVSRHVVVEEVAVEEEPEEVPTELSNWLVSVGPKLVQYGSILAQAGFDSLASVSMISPDDKQYFPDIKIGHWKLLLDSCQNIRNGLGRTEEENQKQLLGREAKQREEEAEIAKLRRAKEEEEKEANNVERLKREEEERSAEQLKREEEARSAEQLKREEEAKLEEQLKREEEARSAEQLKREEEARSAEQLKREEEAKLEEAERLLKEATAAESAAREAEEKAILAQMERDKAALMKKAEEDAIALAAQYAKEAEEKADQERAEQLKLKKIEAKKAAKLAKKAAKKAKQAGGENAQRAQQDLELATNMAKGVAAELEELSTKQTEHLEAASEARTKAAEEMAELATKQRDEEETARRVAQTEAAEVERMKRAAEAARIKAQNTAQKITQKKAEEEASAQMKAEEEAAGQKKVEEEDTAATSTNVEPDAKLESAGSSGVDASAVEKARQEEEAEAARFFDEEDAKNEGMHMPDSWIYVDNHGNTQGPFSSDQMSQWAPFFKPDTKVAPIYDGGGGIFGKLSELFPDATRAFLDPPLRPNQPEENVPVDQGQRQAVEGDDYGDDFEEEDVHEHEEDRVVPVNAGVANDYDDGEFEEDDEYSEDQQPSKADQVALKKNEIVVGNVEQTVEEEYQEEVFEEDQPVVEKGVDNKKKEKAPDNLPESAHSSSFREGVVIEARFQRGPDWFKGKIAKVHNSGKLDISYDDGDFEASVKPKYVRLVELEEEAVEVISEPIHAAEPSRKTRKLVEASTREMSNPDTVLEPSQVADSPFHACINALQFLRNSMNQSGLSGQQLFRQFIDCGKKKSDSEVREFLSLTDFKTAVKKHYRDPKTEAILGLKNSAWTDDHGDHAGDAVLAMLDLTGTGQITSVGFNVFLKGDNLALIWELLRSGIKQSSKLSCNQLDTQLFSRYDKSRKGVVSRDALKRGLKHIKHMQPLTHEQFIELSSSFAVEEDSVNYMNLVSWLNPVRIDKTRKRASRVLRAMLSQQGINSVSRASEEEMSCILDGRDLLSLSDLHLLLSENADKANTEEFSFTETRCLLVNTSSTPYELVVRADGILRIAQNVPYINQYKAINSLSQHDNTVSLEGAPSLHNGANDKDHMELDYAIEQRVRSSRPKSASTKTSRRLEDLRQQ